VDSEVFSSPQPSREEFAGYAGELEKLALCARWVTRRGRIALLEVSGSSILQAVESDAATTHLDKGMSAFARAVRPAG